MTNLSIQPPIIAYPGTVQTVAVVSRGMVRSRRAFHRIAEIRRMQRISSALCAKKLGITVAEVRIQESPQSDLTLSQLLGWQDVLDVPLSEIIVDAGSISDPIRNRALLLKAMKTVRQIQRTAEDLRIKFMATNLADQMIELMPELATVSPWPEFGQSHEPRDWGQAVYRRFEPETAKMIER